MNLVSFFLDLVGLVLSELVSLVHIFTNTKKEKNGLKYRTPAHLKNGNTYLAYIGKHSRQGEPGLHLLPVGGAGAGRAERAHPRPHHPPRAKLPHQIHITREVPAGIKGISVSTKIIDLYLLAVFRRENV